MLLTTLLQSPGLTPSSTPVPIHPRSPASSSRRWTFTLPPTRLRASCSPPLALTPLPFLGSTPSPPCTPKTCSRRWMCTLPRTRPHECFSPRAAAQSSAPTCYTETHPRPDRHPPYPTPTPTPAPGPAPALAAVRRHMGAHGPGGKLPPPDTPVTPGTLDTLV